MGSNTSNHKIRIVTFAWGRRHAEDMLNYALASVMAPGNLPALAKDFDCTVAVVTEAAFFDEIRESSIGCMIAKIATLKLIPLDDLIAESWQYGMTLSHALFRGVEDLGPGMTESYVLFLNADFILADGSYTSLVPHIHNNEPVILSPSYCTIEEYVAPILDERRKNGILTIANREMAALILNNRHNTIRAKTVNQRDFEFEHTDQFYWNVDADTLLCRQMPISLVAMRPERVLKSIRSFWDWGVVFDFCPSRRVSVIGDSDDFLIMELRDEMRLVQSVRLGRSSPKKVAGRMSGYITKYQVDSARYPLVLHSDDVPASAVGASRELDAYVSTVLVNLALKHDGHAYHDQWRYHRRHYRNRLKSARSASQLLRKGRVAREAITERNLADPISRMLRRILETAHPYQSLRPQLLKLFELTRRQPRILLISDPHSYLLRVMDDLPGLQTYLAPQAALNGALAEWPDEIGHFDFCVIEYQNRWSALDAYNVSSVAQAVQNRIDHFIFLWNDRTGLLPMAFSAEIVPVVVKSQSGFEMWSFNSKLSHIACNLLYSKATPLPRWYPRAKIVAAAGLLTASRLMQKYMPMIWKSIPGGIGDNCGGLAIVVKNEVSAEISARKNEQVSRRAATLRESPRYDLYFNVRPKFTKWVVESGALREKFVVVDVGVQGGERPRFHVLKEHLLVHRFDAIREPIDDLRRRQGSVDIDLHYHNFFIGEHDGEKTFNFNPNDSTSSSFNPFAESYVEPRSVNVRSLDSLMKAGVIPSTDFLRIEVEGYEPGIFSGAQQFLSAGVLGVDFGSNFDISDKLPNGHFVASQAMLLSQGLRFFDMNFNRGVRPAHTMSRQRFSGDSSSTANIGAPSTFKFLFCRDPSAERRRTTYFERPPPQLSVDKLIKLMIIFELYGLSDVSVDIAKTFAAELSNRIPADRAIELLC